MPPEERTPPEGELPEDEMPEDDRAPGASFARDAGMTARFRATAQTALDLLLSADPTTAARLDSSPFHGSPFDDVLPGRGSEALQQQTAALGEALGALDDIDDAVLDVDDRVDLEMLRTRLSEELWTVQELRPQVWDPRSHLPGPAIAALLSPEAADPEGRAAALAARLRAVPAALEAGRETLGRMPRGHVQSAVGQTRATLALLAAQAGLLSGVPGGVREMDVARQAAGGALAEHLRWLKAVERDSDADPRLGPERYAARLWYSLDAEIGPDALLTRAESDLMAVEDELAEVAARVPGTVHGGSVPQVLAAVTGQQVPAQTVLSRCSDVLRRLVAQARALDLVTVPGEPVVAELPAWREPGALVGCEVRAMPVVPGTAASGPRVLVARRSASDLELHRRLAREGVPGRAVQAMHASRVGGSTRVRTALASAVLEQGWAAYAEERMAREDAPAGPLAGQPGEQVPGEVRRLVHLLARLRATIDAVLDVRVHARGMSEQEAVSLLCGRGHLGEAQARARWRQALLDGGQLTTGYLGQAEVTALVRDLRAARAGAGERRLHDAVLAHGAPAPRHLRGLLQLD